MANLSPILKLTIDYFTRQNKLNIVPASPTLFTTCKPFEGKVGDHQSIAIRSWLNLGYNVIILGKEAGVADFARRHNCQHIPDIIYSHAGIPLLNSLFETALENTTDDFLCYLNADIILPKNCLGVLNKFCAHPFKEKHRLLVTRRKTLPITRILDDFDKMMVKLYEDDEKFGLWDAPEAIDLFLFDRHMYDNIPPFEIGRMQWDNWLLYEAKSKDCALIDASNGFHILHPFHGYKTGLNDVLFGPSNIKNQTLSNKASLNICEARNYIYINGGFSKCDNSSNKHRGGQGTNGQDRSLDRSRELKSFLHYTKYFLNDMSIDQLWDIIRQFLWRTHYYFPFSEPLNLQNNLAELVRGILINEGNYSRNDEIYFHLQSIVSQKLLGAILLARQEGRQIAIWGTGKLSTRLLSFLERHDIHVDFFIDSHNFDTSFQSRQVVAPERVKSAKNKAFILIASIYFHEISEILENTGYKKPNDYFC